MTRLYLSPVARTSRARRLSWYEFRGIARVVAHLWLVRWWHLVPVCLCLLACDGPSTSSAASWLAANRGLVFLDFSGGTVVPGTVDQSATGTSTLVEAATTIPPFDAAKVAPDAPAALVQAVLLDRVRTQFRDLNVDVTDQKPEAGLYSRIYVGGEAAQLHEPLGVAGLAPIDCGDANGASVAFAFADEHTPVHGGVVQLAATIAHEAGHTFGLVHVDNPSDVLFSVDPQVGSRKLTQLFSAAFTTQANFSSYSAGSEPSSQRCGLTDPIGNHQLLVDRFGVAELPTLPLPSFTWSNPPAAQIKLPLQFRITVEPTPGVPFRRLELYENFSLLGASSAGAIDQVGRLAAGQVVYLVVEMIDSSYQRSREIRRFEGDATLPWACDATSLCPAGQSCALGVCAATPPSGCSWQGRPTNPRSFVLIAGLLIASRLRRRRAIYIRRHETQV